MKSQRRKSYGWEVWWEQTLVHPKSKQYRQEVTIGREWVRVSVPR